MRSKAILLSFVVANAFALSFVLDSSSALADTKPTAGNSKTIVSGAYLLLLNPKSAGGNALPSRTKPVVFPVVVKTDGSKLVIGGKYAPQMTGAISGGSVSAAHTPGKTFTMSGSTFNGYSASGTFALGSGARTVSGTWGLVTLSKGGVGFVGNRAAAGVLGNNRTGIGSSSGFGRNLPGGVSGSWGYDGPGFTGGGSSGPNLGSYGANMEGGNGKLKDWGGSGSSSGSSSSSSSSSRTNTGGNGNSGSSNSSFSNAYNSFTSVGASDGTNSGSTNGSKSGGSNSGGKTNSSSDSSSSSWLSGIEEEASHLADDVSDDLTSICQAFGGCSDKSGSGGGNSGGTSGGKGSTGGFEAGDWEPAGGDTSPGQKPKTGNGQDQGAGGSSGGALRAPSGGGDPIGDWFGAASGDILNSNKLFNGAADPPRAGTSFVRPAIVR